MKRLLMILGVLAAIITSRAAETDSVAPLCPVLTVYTAEVGASKITDTYLSPLKYDGLYAALHFERMQAMKFNPDRWVMQLKFDAEVDRVLSPSRNSEMWYGGVDASWGMMHRWQVAKGLTLAAGGSTTLDLGCRYSMRNGNNPASARAAWTVNATGYAAWNFNIGSLPVTLCYQPTLPVVGAFFSPEYGQLYYEIYLGEWNGLAHAAHWGNYFEMENVITADLRFSATSLRIGYRNNILSTHINNITTRMATHGIVFGLTHEWISLSSHKKHHPQSRIISALY
ncbi:MAG: DUF3316 domain-containing protein [Muribaculaceae bacterium]|nr:DUF3316 domain-containing protein [Muribaculaceae bacterium]